MNKIAINQRKEIRLLCILLRVKIGWLLINGSGQSSYKLLEILVLNADEHITKKKGMLLVMLLPVIAFLIVLGIDSSQDTVT